MFSLNFMFFCSLIEEWCTKEENYKKSCNFNFGRECILVGKYDIWKYFFQCSIPEWTVDKLWSSWKYLNVTDCSFSDYYKITKELKY